MDGEKHSGAVRDRMPKPPATGNPLPGRDPATLAEVISHLVWGEPFRPEHFRAASRLEDLSGPGASARGLGARFRECELRLQCAYRMARDILAEAASVSAAASASAEGGTTLPKRPLAPDP